jgi:hypothetical protein
VRIYTYICAPFRVYCHVSILRRGWSTVKKAGWTRFPLAAENAMGAGSHRGVEGTVTSTPPTVETPRVGRPVKDDHRR